MSGKREHLTVNHSPPATRQTLWRSSCCIGVGLALAAMSPNMLAQQQPGILNGRNFVFDGSFTYPTPVQSADSTIPPTGDLLRFADGSELHGALDAIEPGRTVVWSNPDASGPISFHADSLDLVRFASAKAVPLTPKCRIRFFNGDEIPAEITSLDWERIGVKTWFAGESTIPRATVQSITYMPTGYTAGYEGPMDSQGWAIMTPGSWRYRDGVFTSRGAGSLGRDMQLSGSCTLEFDLTCTSPFHLLMGLYIQRDQIDYGNDLYVVEMSAGMAGPTTAGWGTVRIRRNNPGVGPADLGSAPLPTPGRKNRIHFAIQCNQEEKSLTILADNQVVRRWKDEVGFVGKGTRVAFSDLSMVPGLALSNFRVSRWQGREPSLGMASQTNSDAIWLANRDRASGKITGLSGGKAEFLLNGHQIQIPLDRITKIEFAPAGPVAPSGHEVRAILPGGTRLLLELDKWNSTEISAHSACLGAIALKPWMIRELDFNPGRIEPEPAGGSDDFGGMDD